jgi:tetratricopeptide (TPR) repeat protein
MRLFQTFVLACAVLMSAAAVTQATTRHPIEARCGLCGKESTQHRLGSFSFPFPADLDFQPALGVRNRLWIKECPHCGWIARDFSAPVPVRVRAAFESKAYKDIADLAVTDNARIFLRVALLEEAAEQWWEAGLDYIAAAWLCDPGEKRWTAEMEIWEQRQRRERERRAESDTPEEDADAARQAPEPDPVLPSVDPAMQKTAAALRAKAIPLLEKAFLQPPASEEVSALPYLLAEMYRRAGQFATAAAWLARAEAVLAVGDPDIQERLAPMIAVQELLIKAKDSDRHIDPEDL